MTQEDQENQHLELEHNVPIHLGNKRFDQIASELFDGFSRSRLKNWILSGELQVNGEARKPKEKLVAGDVLTLSVELEPVSENIAEDIPLDIQFEDEHILVINKPAGLVVHPGAGNATGTVLNAILHHCPEVVHLPRAGIVHRLDKDTTGLMVIAKTHLAHQSLVEQLQSREMGREYEAVAIGVMTSGGHVDEPIARHPTQRTKMGVHPTGKPAVTHYRVLQRFRNHTHVRLKLESGRTHQIRVHMSYIHYPLVGDILYNGRARLSKGMSPELQQLIREFPRQALHAKRLELEHPETGEPLAWETELPEDINALLLALKQDAEEWKTDDF